MNKFHPQVFKIDSLSQQILMQIIHIHSQSIILVIIFLNFSKCFSTGFLQAKRNRLLKNLRNRLVPRLIFINKALIRAFKENAKSDVKMFNLCQFVLDFFTLFQLFSLGLSEQIFLCSTIWHAWLNSKIDLRKLSTLLTGSFFDRMIFFQPNDRFFQKLELLLHLQVTK